jgi:hypothetical protein
MTKKIMLKLNRQKLIKLSISGLTIVALVIGGFFLWNKPKITEATWWNDSWQYRQAIDVTNNTSAQTNVYISLTLNTNTASTSMQTDCGDFRFVTENGEILEYYVQSGCRSTITVVHIAFATFPAGQQTIYFYYGNPSADNGFTSDINGSVTQANMRLSIATSTAFVDFSAPNTLTPYLGQNLVITDSAGKKLIGYIKTAGTGETYGSELTGNQTFEDTTGLVLKKSTVASVVGGESGNCLEITGTDIYPSVTTPDPFYNGNSGNLYKFIGYSKKGSDNGVWLSIAQWDGTVYEDLGSGYWNNQTSWVQSTLYGTSKVGDQFIYFSAITNTSGLTGYIDTFSGKQVLTPSITGVTIASTSNGSTYNWASEESGFNRNDSSGYTYNIYPISFSLEASNYTIGSVSSAETGPGPVGYWSFDEGYGATAHDNTANKNDGTILGAVWQDESQCVSGKCMFFDGSGDWIKASSSNNLNVTNQITVNAWIKPQFESALYYGIVSKQKISPTSGYQFVYDNTDKSIYLYVNDQTVAWSKQLNLENNKWYFVSATYVGSASNGKIYLDGADVTINGNGTTFNTNNLDLTIGARADDNASPFKGSMDEVKIYPYARTADQIKQDYAAGLAGVKTNNGISAGFGSASDKWMSDGLVGYWKMDESTTTDGTADSSGSGNIGYFTGDASTTAGKYGNGISSYDSGDYIWAGNNTSINITDEITLSTWVQQYDFTANSNSYPIYKGNAYYLIVAWGGDNCGFGLTIDGTYRTTNNYYFSTAERTGWHNLVGTYSKQTRTLKFYVDGIEVESNTLSGLNTYNIATSTNSLYLGMQASASRLYHMDETRIYSRALSADEVRKLYEWAPGPVGHWKMDELNGNTTYDNSGNGNNGILGDGNATYRPAWFNLGKYGGSLNFDGDNDYLSIDHKPYFALPPFTAEAWVKFDQLPSVSGKYENFLTKKNSSSPYDTWMVYGDNYPSNQDHISFGVVDNSGTGFYVTSDSTVSAGTWYHVVAMLDSNYSMNLYINGIKQLSTDNSGSIHNSDSDFYIGVQYFDGSQFNGLIDEVKFYNYIRTQKQILEDMNSDAPGLYPVLNLSFDEGYGATAHDSTIYGNNGTLNPGISGSNTATSAMWTRDGKFGKAIEFDGTDDYVEIADNSVFDVTDEVTLAAWVYPVGFDNSYENSIVSKAGNGSYGVYNLHYKTTSKGFRFEINDGASHTLFESKPSTALKTWYHVVGIYDGSMMKLYINGQLSNTAELSTSINTNNEPLRVGKQYWFGSQYSYWNGLIDEVKIYPYALTEDEIKQDYNQNKAAVMGQMGKSNSTATSSGAASLEYCVPGSTDYCAAPVGEWKMDEMTGNTAYDTSGNGNDGSLGGGTADYRPAWSNLGKYGNALNFDGADDFINIPNFGAMGTNDFSVSFWAKTPAVTPNSWYDTFITPGNGNSYPMWENNWTIDKMGDADVPSNQNKIQFSVGKGTGAGYFTISSSITIADTDWHYITGTADRDGNAIIYIDGINRGSTDISSVIADLTAPIGLSMGSNNGGGFYLTGLMDQIRVYNYVRTPAQIAWEYNRGKPVGYWKFDECSGGTIHDSSGSGNNGTLNLGTSGVTATGTCASSSNSFWYNGRTGKKNSAGSFDGIDDYVSLGSGNSLNVNNSNFSIGAWVNLSSQADNQFIYEGIYGKALLNVSPYQKLVLTMRNSGDTDWDSYTGKNVLATFGTWHFLLATYDGANVKLYVDGQLDGSFPRTGAMGGIGPTDNIIGGRTNAWTKGLIDEVKIFNYALTVEQVKQEYSGGAVKFGN